MLRRSLPGSGARHLDSAPLPPCLARRQDRPRTAAMETPQSVLIGADKLESLITEIFRAHGCDAA